MDLERLVIRSLDRDEIQDHVFQTDSDEPAPKSKHSIVVVAELDGKTLATITAERVWCVSNFWADHALRGTGVAERVAREIASLNTENLTEMLCTTSHHVELLAHRFGFTPIKGTLFRR